MRYLSDDGKVFNSAAECDAHESSIKKKDEEKKKNEEQAKDLEKLMKLMEEVKSKTAELEQAMEAYDKKWKSDTTKVTLNSSKCKKPFTMSDFILDYMM